MRRSEILIDQIGLGAEVYDRCKEMSLPVRAINVGQAAATRENCMRLRDELWFKGREWFQDRSCSMPKDDTLVDEGLDVSDSRLGAPAPKDFESHFDFPAHSLNSGPTEAPYPGW